MDDDMAKMLDDARVKVGIWFLGLVFLAGGLYYQFTEVKAQVADLRHDVAAVNAIATEGSAQLREIRKELALRVEQADRQHEVTDRRLDRLEVRRGGDR